MKKPNQVGGKYSHYVLFVLVIVYIFNFIDRNILSILAEDIKADLLITDAQMGFLYGTVFAVFYAVFGIPLARLADVWSRRSLIAIGLSFWSAMTAASGLARSFGALAMCRVGVGIGEASASPAAYSMLSDYYPPAKRATVIAIYASGVYIGAGIGVFLGGFILDWWAATYPTDAPFGLRGWQAAFMAVGIPGLVIAGGAVIGALTSCPAGDVDIFLRTSADEAEATLTRIFEAVQRNQGKIAKKRLMVTRSRNAISFYRVSGERVVLPPVQVCPRARCVKISVLLFCCPCPLPARLEVILALVESPLGLLLDFDCDSLPESR